MQLFPRLTLLTIQHSILGRLVVMFNVPFYLGGTSMLIVVVVVMDFMAQVQSHLMSHQYEGVMKKANLTNIGPAGRTR